MQDILGYFEFSIFRLKTDKTKVITATILSQTRVSQGLYCLFMTCQMFSVTAKVWFAGMPGHYQDSCAMKTYSCKRYSISIVLG